MLNPWVIEVESLPNTEVATMVRLNLINQETGEIRQVQLGVDDIHHIAIIDTLRLEPIANTIDTSGRSILDTELGLSKLVELKIGEAMEVE